MDDPTARQGNFDSEYLTDEALESSLRLDYAEIAAATEPGQPGGRTVYDSADYETEEDAEGGARRFL